MFFILFFGRFWALFFLKITFVTGNMSLAPFFLFFFFDWFHSNLNRPGDLHFGSVSECKRTGLAFWLLAGLNGCRSFLSAHSYCLDIMPFRGPQYSQLSTQYSTLDLAHGGFKLPKNNHFNRWSYECIVIIEYFCPQWSDYWIKPFFTLPLVRRREPIRCTLQILQRPDWFDFLFAEKWKYILCTFRRALPGGDMFTFFFFFLPEPKNAAFLGSERDPHVCLFPSPSTKHCYIYIFFLFKKRGRD